MMKEMSQFAWNGRGGGLKWIPPLSMDLFAFRFSHRGRFRLAAAIVFIAALSAPAFQDPPSPSDKTFTLDNGLRVFLLERRNLPLVHAVAAVNAGTKDETDATSGLTHLLEHAVLFRGTDVRSGNQVARDIRRHGAYFNAHTGQDLTLFEISVPAEHAAFALRNQKDILFHLRLTAEELDAEKEVIAEEILRIEDDPFRRGSALINQNLFPGHPYGRPVYGRRESLEALTLEDVEGFYRRFYVPGNMALAVVGDFRIAEMEAEVRAVFGPVPHAERPDTPLSPPSPLSKTVEIALEMDVEEGYLVVGAAGPDYSNPDQFAADVLTQSLGQGLSPMLVQALRGGSRDLIHSAFMNYAALKRAGAFIVFLTLDPRWMSAAKREAIDFLRRVRSLNFSKEEIMGQEAKDAIFEHLESAKNGLRIAVEKAWESGLGLAQSLAMHMLLRESPAPIDYLQRVARVTPSDLRTIGSRYLSRNAFVVVSITPKKGRAGQGRGAEK